MRNVGNSRSRNSDTKGMPARACFWSRWMVRLAVAASVMASVVLAGGFAYGTYAALGGPVGGTTPPETGLSPSNTADTTPEHNKVVHLVALGDSLAHGLGDASGRGFVGDVRQQYQKLGYKVVQSNLGIDGLTSSGLLKELQQASVQDLLRSADVILVSIGGNDLSRAAGLPRIDVQRIGKAQEQFAANLTAILTDIRKWNQTAPVLLVGLYNPYADVASSAVLTNSVVESWVVREIQVASRFPQTVVVQTFDLFLLHGPQFLYVDHFHPNQAGYQRIAARIWQDLQTR
jgi:lysophospholipase L1-like esterase